MDQQCRWYSENSHILVIETLTVILTFKLADQFFCMKLQLMMHHHTKFGYKSLSGSQDIICTKSGHMDRWIDGPMHTVSPIILPLISLRIGGRGRWRRGDEFNIIINYKTARFLVTLDHKMCMTSLSHQSTGFEACWRRYGDFSNASRFWCNVPLESDDVAIARLKKTGQVKQKICIQVYGLKKMRCKGVPTQI